MSIALITGIFGGYDTLKPLPEGLAADAFLVTDDRQNIMRQDAWSGPRYELIEYGAYPNPRLAAKAPKTLPFTDPALSGYDWVVWIDGSHEVIYPDFPEKATKWVENQRGFLGTYAHPFRDDILEEAEFAATLPKYTGIDLVAQAQAYLAEGHRRHSGLWATGTLCWRNCEESQKLGHAWHNEMHMTTVHDQISLPVVLRRLSLNATAFPHRQVPDNPWTAIRSHADGT